MKKFLKEFKDFAMRGNVMDLAVGVIIGGAFQAIVNSLVNDVIMPFIGLFVREDGFEGMAWTITTGFGTANIQYGNFIGAVINFVIMAFVIFLLVKGLNKLSTMGKKEDTAAPTTKKCPYCFTEIAIEATKCPNCTADLPAASETEKAKA